MSHRILMSRRRRAAMERQSLVNEQLYKLFEGKGLYSPHRLRSLSRVAKNMLGMLENNAVATRSWIMPLIVVSNELAKNPRYALAAEKVSRAAAIHSYYDPVVQRGAIDAWRSHHEKLPRVHRKEALREVVKTARPDSLFKAEAKNMLRPAAKRKQQQSDAAFRPAASKGRAMLRGQRALQV